MLDAVRSRSVAQFAWLTPLFLRLAIVVSIPVILFGVQATAQKGLDAYRLSQQAAALRANVMLLRDENLSLQRDLQDAQTDAAIERLARTELGLVLPGDNALVIVPSDTARGPVKARGSITPSPPVAVPVATPEAPAIHQWQEFFFGATPGQPVTAAPPASR